MGISTGRQLPEKIAGVLPPSEGGQGIIRVVGVGLALVATFFWHSHILTDFKVK